nr:hypothetical protein [Streptomyces sp. TLI_235]
MTTERLVRVSGAVVMPDSLRGLHPAWQSEQQRHGDGAAGEQPGQADTGESVPRQQDESEADGQDALGDLDADEQAEVAPDPGDVDGDDDQDGGQRGDGHQPQDGGAVPGVVRTEEGEDPRRRDHHDGGGGEHQEPGVAEHPPGELGEPLRGVGALDYEGETHAEHGDVEGVGDDPGQRVVRVLGGAEVGEHAQRQHRVGGDAGELAHVVGGGVALHPARHRGALTVGALVGRDRVAEQHGVGDQDGQHQGDGPRGEDAGTDGEGGAGGEGAGLGGGEDHVLAEDPAGAAQAGEGAVLEVEDGVARGGDDEGGAEQGRAQEVQAGGHDRDDQQEADGCQCAEHAGDRIGPQDEPPCVPPGPRDEPDEDVAEVEPAEGGHQGGDRERRVAGADGLGAVPAGGEDPEQRAEPGREHRAGGQDVPVAQQRLARGPPEHGRGAGPQQRAVGALAGQRQRARARAGRCGAAAGQFRYHGRPPPCVRRRLRLTR